MYDGFDRAIAAWNRRATKQAEGVVRKVYDNGTEGEDENGVSCPVGTIEVPQSWIGKRVIVSLLDEADGGTKEVIS